MPSHAVGLHDLWGHRVEASWLALRFRGAWIKSKNPAAAAVKREAEEDWGRWAMLLILQEAIFAVLSYDLLNVIHKLGDKPKRVILFGHNPELTEFAHRLSSEITHMPTCAVAEFTFNAKSWSHLGKAKLAKVVLDYPKKS
jgi:hypothetical protein